MTEEKTTQNNDDDFWKRKIAKHWKAFIIFVIGCILAAIGAVMVLFWFIETSPIGAMGTAAIGEWTIAWIWQFFIFLILWELLIVGIPVAIAFGVGWHLWRRNMSEEEKAEFKGKWKGRGTAESGGFGFFMFIAYTIYIYIIGDLFTSLDTYSYSYWVYSFFHMLAWLLIIIGIPATIILPIVYFKVWRKKETKTQIT